MIAAALFGAVVHLLPLPRAATIDPFGPRALMAASADGRIAATVTLNGYRSAAVVWDRFGQLRAFLPAASVAGFDTTGAVLLNAPHPSRLVRAKTEPIDTRVCENFPHASLGPVLAGGSSDGSLILTMQSPAIVDLDDTSGQNAPVVLHLRNRECLNMGNGVALATSGLFSAGYVAYIANVPAPSNVASSKERFVAMRWEGRTPQVLGPGVALAVNADGAAAGTTTPPGTNVAYAPAPQARVWHRDATVVEPASSAPLSAAYAVDARGRVAGMLEDAQRRHYAFLWDRGTLRRLDDVVRAPGWRFECAYAFTPSGGIAGIGTFRGSPAAFVIDGI